MEKFSREKIEDIRRYPFLNKIDELDEPQGKKVYLRYGAFYEVPPFLNIIIPTYKRPQMLRETLESVLKSDGFADYQIIIMDNEGMAENPGITQTEQMIRELNSHKIVYYREEENTPFNWNHLIKYARAEWLCMIHDDDMIDRNHLKIMSDIVKKYRNIEYLGCRLQSFHAGESTSLQTSVEKVNIYYYACSDFMYGFQVPLLGAFFKRKNAVELGGTDTKILSGIGDYIFVVKQAFYFNIYQCDAPLYKYRISSNQLTANTDGEYNCRISDYYLIKEIARKTHPIMKYFYFRSAERAWMEKVLGWCSNKTYGDRKTNAEDIFEACDVKGRMRKKAKKRNYFAILYWGMRKRIFKYIHPVITMQVGSGGNGY